MYVQIPRVVMNLVFPYSGKGPLVPILQSISWGGVRREVASGDWDKKQLLSTSAYSSSTGTRLPFLFIGGRVHFL